MNDINDILQIEPYSLDSNSKKKFFNKRIEFLSRLHAENCKEYSKMLDILKTDNLANYQTVPFLPTRLFKSMLLKSISEKEIFKIMTSSGTTGQQVSKIVLDKKNAAMQQKVLAKIINSFTGKKRMPMLILDCPSVIKNREMFSARGAGILGFSIFGSDKLYAFDDNMNLRAAEIREFLCKHKNENIFIFGFTFMIWQYFYKALMKENIRIDLSKGILIHGGGWKKLTDEAVSNEDFKRSLFELTGLKRIYNYYGMVEQTGCIYMECEHGHLHASIFSDVIIRRTKDFSIADKGETGIIQAISLLPESYPGHSLLTEDEGVLLGVDDCPCGRLGKYFKINGRLKKAEIRGCSDTYGK